MDNIKEINNEKLVDLTDIAWLIFQYLSIVDEIVEKIQNNLIENKKYSKDENDYFTTLDYVSQKHINNRWRRYNSRIW